MRTFSWKMVRRGSAIGALALVLLGPVAASPLEAAPIYVTGNECPTDTSMGGYNRQYSITQAIACIYNDSSSNITGTDSEADAYLNTAAAQPTWGTGWTGLGSDPTGFTFTTDAGNDDGTFAIDSSVLAYEQFAVAIKDGGAPKWAIFLLPVDTLTGDWHFMTSGGELSHFALFGRGEISAVPEPASLFLLGSGLALITARTRNLRKRAA